ncbi:MAG: CRISPR-associated endonuclease Cas1 [Treponema sp. CETP13]|nr:MAG: CRISPR-associated endonuclease Cas1 [Treponema sp. CETP13]
MAFIYILSDYGKLSKENETLLFFQDDGTKTILFPFKTEQLVLMGNISITGGAFRLIHKYKIPITFLSSNGKFNSKLVYEEPKNIILRQRQFNVISNKQKSLEIAGSIVLGKIKNQIAFLQRVKRKSNNLQVQKSISISIEQMKQKIQSISTATDIDQLRGLEGAAARLYFSVLKYNITPDWAIFKSRSRNPPKSNVNAVLSFLYTLLMYRVSSAIESQGLDTMAGILHVINYGRSSLVFDLMEEFRTPIADSICCSLFNLKKLKEDDFEQKVFSEKDENYPIKNYCDEEENKDNISFSVESEKGVLLTKNGLKKVVKSFEEKMDTQIFYEPLQKKISYQRIMIEQAKLYKRVILGEENKYQPYYFK